MNSEGEKLVEAIEEGRIVKVPEDYAKREGLPILRKPKIKQIQENVPKIPERNKTEEETKNKLSLEISKRPLDWRKNQVISELIDNFHWYISKTRKNAGLTRKQLAQLINEREETIKMIEYGILPSSDFVVINKIQDALGINLRKDKINMNKSMHELLETKEQEKIEQKIDEEIKSIQGSEIQIYDDEEL